ncbi:hypothetical protein GWO43_28220 [candidate division KSB1 bacterium]|nr:hypothetical protein [candidate division KSB1 bacterium]NIT74676.1 hypothetical protein [candidate division KSB1 bacterium]NIX74356.1 hypothetical protein [candidate division KSB1 bacterium]
MRTFIGACSIAFVLAAAFQLFAQNAVAINPANSETSAASIYTLEFSLPDSLSSNGAISIVFPDGFDLSGVSIAASSRIKGGFSTFVKGQTVLVFRNGEGDVKQTGEKVDLMLSAVKNPELTAGRFNLKLFIHEDSQKLHALVQNGQYQITNNDKGIQGAFRLSTRR